MPANATFNENSPVIRAQIDVPGTHLNHIIWMDGEEIIKITSDHWISFLSHMLIPGVILIVATTMAILRGLGLQFFVTTGIPATEFGLINAILVAVVAMLILAAFIFPGHKQSKPGTNKTVAPLRAFLLTLALIVVGVIAYRFFLGGRVVYFDSTTQPSLQTFLDLPNFFLMAIAALMIPIIYLIYVECENDHLILTNRRVILSDRTIMGRYSTDEISIESIQDVSVKSDTYLAHWLRYGTIRIQSASQSRRGPLMFPTAEHAQDMQKQIMDQVNAKRGETSEREFREMIDEKVYKKKVPHPPPPKEVHAQAVPPLLRRLIAENPEINEENGTITWRRHWLFMVYALLRPFGFFFVVLLGLFLVMQFSLAPNFVLWVALVAILVFFVAWIAYEIEDYRNDMYILSPSNITDIEQKPWGPSNRRNASLGAIQNVNSNTTLISRMLGYGDVILETAGASGQFTFFAVPDPIHVVATINNYRDEFKRGDKARSLDDALKMLRFYHESSDVTAQGRMQELRFEIQELQRELGKLREQLPLPNSGNGGTLGAGLPDAESSAPITTLLPTVIEGEPVPPDVDARPVPAPDKPPTPRGVPSYSDPSPVPRYAELYPMPADGDAVAPEPPRSTTPVNLPVYDPNQDTPVYTVRSDMMPNDPDFLNRLLKRGPAADPPAVIPSRPNLPRYEDTSDAARGTDTSGTVRSTRPINGDNRI